jgi:CRP/FNR family transcriptional activator FtrB
LLSEILLERPYGVGVDLIEDSRVVLLPAERCRNAVNGNPAVARAFATTLARQLGGTLNQIRELKTLTAAQRLAAYILESMNGMPEGSTRVTLPFDRRVIAGLLGMAPESLSRALRELKKVGVEGRGRQLRIAAVERLRRYADTA